MKHTNIVYLTGIAVVAACSTDLVIDHRGDTPDAGAGGRGSGGIDARGADSNAAGAVPGTGGASQRDASVGGSGPGADAEPEAGGTIGRGHPDGGPVESGSKPVGDSCGAVVKLDSIDGTGPGSLVLDGANVFWTQGNSLRRVSKSGGDGVTIADSSEGVAVDVTYVYWSSYTGDTLSRSVKTGTPGPVILQTGFGSPQDLAVSDGLLYVATNQGLARVGTEVGATPTIIAADASPGSAIVADDTSIYFRDSNSDLIKLDKTTQTRTTLAYGVSDRFAIDGTAAYYTSSGIASELLRVNRVGGLPTSLGQISGRSFALDAESAYFYLVVANKGTLVSVPKTSGGPTTLSTVHDVGEPEGGHYIGVDDAHVFFIDGPSLMRYTKCSAPSADGGTGNGPRVDAGCPAAGPSDAGAGAPSCAGLPATCGPCENEDCCASTRVSGGTFYRTYEGPNLSDRGDPATVSDFRLDRFEITVGRFRRFVAAWDAGYRPGSNAGKHSHLNRGFGLSTRLGFEYGWLDGDADELPTTASGDDGWDARLSCDTDNPSWTSSPGANETKPVRCLDWYAAYAFCIWDGGFLPSEAEWAYAATGGAEQRVFPWSSPAASAEIDCTRANYLGAANGTDYCTAAGVGAPNRVGWNSPLGDGKFGQADLAGNVAEWTLDSYDRYEPSCIDCVAMRIGNDQVVRGGGYNYGAAYLHTTNRASVLARSAARGIGARCARTP